LRSPLPQPSHDALQERSPAAKLHNVDFLLQRPPPGRNDARTDASGAGAVFGPHRDNHDADLKQLPATIALEKLRAAQAYRDEHLRRTSSDEALEQAMFEEANTRASQLTRTCVVQLCSTAGRPPSQLRMLGLSGPRAQALPL
jgi:hypothetical protein